MTNTLLSKSSRVIYLLQLFSFISLLAYVCGVSVVCVCCVPSSLAFQMQFYAVASCVLALLAVSVHFYSFVVVASVFDSAQCTMFVNVFQHFFQPFRFFFLHLFFFIIILLYISVISVVRCVLPGWSILYFYAYFFSFASSLFLSILPLPLPTPSTLRWALCVCVHSQNDNLLPKLEKYN